MQTPLRRSRLPIAWRVFALVLLTLCFGCESKSESDDPTPGRNSSTRASTVPAEPPQRIVSLAPNLTEMLFALELGDRVVGRTSFCTFPPAAQAAPDLGGVGTLSAEALLAARPDLVVIAGTAPNSSMREMVDALELEFLALPDARLTDLFAALEQLGDATARRAAANRLRAQIEQQLDEAAHDHDASPADRGAAASPRVLVCAGVLSDPPRPVYVAGRNSFYDDLLQRGGLANAAGGIVDGFAPLSFEAILKLDPDVIIELDADPRSTRDDARARALWSRVGPLKAVTAERVHVIHGARHYILGPRIAETARALYRASWIAADLPRPAIPESPTHDSATHP